MGQCALCGQRKGERSCPALAEQICGPCCGKHRRKTVQCLPSCPHLMAAERQQRQRRAEELAQAWGEWQAQLSAQGQDELWRYIEALGRVLAQMLQQADADDAHAEAALRHLGQTLSPITMVGAAPPLVGRMLTETLLPAVEGGRLSAPQLRDATMALADWLADYRREDEPRRFVLGLLGLLPPQADEQPRRGVIERP